VADAPPVSPKAEAQLSAAQYTEIYDRLIAIFQARPRDDWKRLIVFSRQWPQHKQGVFDRCAAWEGRGRWQARGQRMLGHTRAGKGASSGLQAKGLFVVLGVGGGGRGAGGAQRAMFGRAGVCRRAAERLPGQSASVCVHVCMCVCVVLARSPAVGACCVVLSHAAHRRCRRRNTRPTHAAVG
jgi:hypothetical protein